MQTQSRLIDGASAAAAVDEQYYEAVVRELTRGHELTVQLQGEALRALRGQGQAEGTAALILREVSRAFTVSISIMGGAAPAAAAAPPDATSVAAAGARRGRDDGAPRTRTLTPSPYSDGYEWRKYGQKRIMRTSFPRCYYRCSYHRERGCPATKRVQEQHSSGGGPTMYLVVYVHEHTCHLTSPAAAAAPAEAARSPADLLDFSAGLSRGGVAPLNKEELEQQALVSSLACVLQGSLQCYSGGGSPVGSWSQGLAGDAGEDGGASAPAVSTELPTSLGDDEWLDFMDYDVTDTLYFGDSSSYGRDDDMLL